MGRKERTDFKQITFHSAFFFFADGERGVCLCVLMVMGKGCVRMEEEIVG